MASDGRRELPWREFATWCVRTPDWESVVKVDADDGEPHDHHCDEPAERSKWARVANRLRERHAACALRDEVYDAMEEVGGWMWDRSASCACDGCLGDADDEYSRHLYTERLVRAEPWYTAEDEKEKDALCALAAEHWESFFGPMQEGIGRVVDANVKRWPLGVEFSKWSDVCDQLNVKIPECFIEAGKVTRKLYEVCAVLNAARR